MRSTAILLTVCMLLAAANAVGQDLGTLRTELCERDSLYVISPEQVSFGLSEGGESSDLRFGMILRWDDLALADATCFALRGEDTLDIDVVAEGGFGDTVDRVIRFTTIGSGEVGADQSMPLLLGWRNEGPSTYGNLAGFINLANNGGFVDWDAGAGAWQKYNTGLPRTWRQVNVVDMAMAGDGTMWASLTSGQTPESEMRGLFRHNGTGWSEVAPEIFGEIRMVTAVAVAPDNPEHVAVATLRDGFFVSTDGFSTFDQWTTELKPDLEVQPSTFRVTALDWTDTRIIAAVRTLGVFISENNGADFVEAETLEVPDDLDKLVPTMVIPEVNQIVSDPTDPDRILLALRYHGVYESTDRGLTWSDMYGDLLVPDPEDNGIWVRSALSVALDPSSPQTLVMGVEQYGLYHTTNGGLNWTLVGENAQPVTLGQLRSMDLCADPATPGRMYAMEDGWSLLSSDDAGATWDHFAIQPTLNSAMAMVVRPGGDGGNFVLGTWRGGMYETGMAISLSDTYSPETSSFLRTLDLGLDLRFHGGNLTDNAGDTSISAEAFELVGQTYQGWAVWRATADEPDDMTLIGKFDRVNPEACIEGFCGADNFQPIPQCYHSTRAACFTYDPENEDWYFFDDEVYNAFRYNYAVTTFDYANTAEVTPQNLPRDMITSPRWTGDPLSIFSGAPWNGAGNREFLQVDRPAEPTSGGEGIYVFPNPLRNDAGIPGEEGKTVVFTNLPEGARVRIFTTAGDDVANMGPENLNGGQIRWMTRNREQEPVAAGVYLYKVEVPDQEDHWGRLVIIR